MQEVCLCRFACYNTVFIKFFCQLQEGKGVALSVGSSLLDLRKLKKRIVKLNPDWESTNQKVYTVDSLEKGTNSTMMYVFPVQKVSYYSLRKLCRSRE